MRCLIAVLVVLRLTRLRHLARFGDLVCRHFLGRKIECLGRIVPTLFVRGRVGPRKLEPHVRAHQILRRRLRRRGTRTPPSPGRRSLPARLARAKAGTPLRGRHACRLPQLPRSFQPSPSRQTQNTRRLREGVCAMLALRFSNQHRPRDGRPPCPRTLSAGGLGHGYSLKRAVSL